MILTIYLISLIWMVIFLTKFVKPFRQKKRLEQNKIKYIPLKRANDPHKKYYVLNSGELIEVTK